MSNWIRRFIIIFIISFTLTISPTSHAAADDPFFENSTAAIGGAIVAVGVGEILAALAHMFLKTEASPATCGAIKLVYKDSTPTTYSFPGETHTDGKITVKNTSSQTIQLSASVKSDAEGKANIQILPSSSCNNSVIPGATCSFDFSYADNFPTADATIKRVKTLVDIRCGSNGGVLLSFPIISYFPGYYYFLSLSQNTTPFNQIASDAVFSVSGQEDTVYLATQSGLNISHDNGESWITYNVAQGQGLLNNMLLAVGVSGDTIAVGILSSGVAVSLDNGESWKTYTTGQGLGSNNVLGIYVSGNTIYAATLGGGLSVSKNGGASWTIYQSPTIANNNVRGVYAIGNNIYAATEGGLSVYDGMAWHGIITLHQQILGVIL